MLALGIDLGTAFVRAAVFHGGSLELLQFPDGAHSTPAVVSMGGGSTRVGRTALSRATTHPAETVRGIKRLLGRSVDDPVLRRIAQTAAFEVVGQGREPVRLRLGDATLETEKITAALLGHLAEVSEQRLGKRPTQVVLTSPYWYGSRQREALKRAASLAGFTVLQVISEATATALSLIDAEPETRHVAIVDVGAGGCSASILEMGKAGVRLLASGGDPLGGGEDVDQGLMRAVIKGVRAKVGDFPDSPAIFELVRQVCETAKRDISDAAQVSAVIPFLPIGSGVFNQQVRIDRRNVEQLMQDTTLRIAAACQSALEESALDKSELAAVYATGGMTRLKTVRDSISRVLGEISSRRLDPDGSVALGAAYQGGMLVGGIDSIPVIDVQTKLSVPPAAPNAAASMPPLPVMTAPPPARASDKPPDVDTGAFRVELAGLLAHLRAGALTDGAGAPTTHSTLVARANDVVETDADDSPEARERAVTHLRGVWKQLSLTMQTARQYRWDHPQTIGALAAAKRAVDAAAAESVNAVRWDVRSTRFSFKGEDVWKPDRPPYDRIPHEVFADGVRKVQLRGGISVAELRRLLGVLLRDPALGFGADDDAATALWDAKFEHVAYVAVDAFTEADEPEFEEQRDELAKELAKIANLSGDSESVLGNYTAAQRDIAPQVDAASLSAEERLALTGDLDPGEQIWLQRFARAFSQSYAATASSDGGVELVAAVRRYCEEQLTAGHPLEAFAKLTALTQAFEADFGPDAARDLFGRLVAEVFSAEHLVELFQTLGAIPQLTANVVESVSHVLQALPDDRFVLSGCELHASLRPELSAVLNEYLARHVVGNEQHLGELVAIAPRATAERFLALLQETDSPAAQAAVQRGLASPHAEIRLRALACLPQEASEQLQADVKAILEDPEPTVRDRALQVIAEQKLTVAGPALMTRARDESFHDLPLREQRLILECIAGLNRERAEALGLEILERKSLLGAENVELSRALAAEFLSQFDSEAVLGALKKVAKKSWFRSSPAQEAASHAVTHIEYRRSQPPGGKADR
ncbi:MAG: Hsp70 family protein [Polyangiaceae bacterium]